MYNYCSLRRPAPEICPWGPRAAAPRGRWTARLGGEPAAGCWGVCFGGHVRAAARSVVEGCQVEPAEALRVGEYVDFGDLPVRDREAHDRQRLPTGRRDEPGGPVDERQLGEWGKPREGERLPGHRRRTVHHR